MILNKWKRHNIPLHFGYLNGRALIYADQGQTQER